MQIQAIDSNCNDIQRYGSENKMQGQVDVRYGHSVTSFENEPENSEGNVVHPRDNEKREIRFEGEAKDEENVIRY